MQDLFVGSQFIYAALAGLREHAGESLLHAGSDAGLVAVFGERIGDDLAMQDKDIDEVLHVRDAGSVAPDGIEALRDGEVHAHRTHKYKLTDFFWMCRGGRECYGGAH